MRALTENTPFQLLVCAVLFLFLGSVQAEQGQQFTLSMSAQKEVVTLNPDGSKKIEYVAADSVIPGDILLYTISYKNSSADAVEDVVISNPLPEHMTYVTESAAGDNSKIQFSVDGGINYDDAANLTITQADGTIRPAVSSDYTHIRWSFEQSIPASSNGSVSYRAKLN